LKKYCECFNAGIVCSENCRCAECRNFEDCLERKAILAAPQISESQISGQLNEPLKYDGILGIMPRLEKEKSSEISGKRLLPKSIFFL